MVADRQNEQCGSTAFTWSSTMDVRVYVCVNAVCLLIHDMSLLFTDTWANCSASPAFLTFQLDKYVTGTCMHFAIFSPLRESHI